MPDLAQHILRCSLTGSDHNDLLGRLTPTLAEWATHPDCTYATAFFVRWREFAWNYFNDLQIQDAALSAQHKKVYDAFVYLTRGKSWPSGARLPWTIIRERQKKTEKMLFHPHILIDKRYAETVTGLDGCVPVPLARPSETDFHKLLDSPEAFVSDRFAKSSNSDSTSMECFCYYPAFLADKLRNHQPSPIGETSAVLLFMGTRRHTSDAEASFDYGLSVGLSESVLKDKQLLSSIIDSAWAAWIVMVAPLYLQHREERLNHFRYGQNIFHALKSHLHKNIFHDINELVSSGKLCAEAADSLKTRLDCFPTFISFVARKPCAETSEEEVRPEDAEPGLYDPGYWFGQALRNSFERDRGGEGSKYSRLDFEYPDFKKENEITFVRKDFADIFIADLVDNAIKHGDTSMPVKYLVSVENNLMTLSVTNSLREQNHDSAITPSDGRGLASILAFCGALGGQATFRRENGFFIAYMTIPLCKFSLRMKKRKA